MWRRSGSGLYDVGHIAETGGMVRACSAHFGTSKSIVRIEVTLLNGLWVVE